MRCRRFTGGTASVLAADVPRLDRSCHPVSSHDDGRLGGQSLRPPPSPGCGVAHAEWSPCLHVKVGIRIAQSPPTLAVNLCLRWRRGAVACGCDSASIIVFELLSEHEHQAAVNRRTLPRPRDFATLPPAVDSAKRLDCGASAPLRVGRHRRACSKSGGKPPHSCAFAMFKAAQEDAYAFRVRALQRRFPGRGSWRAKTALGPRTATMNRVCVSRWKTTVECALVL